MIHLGRTPIETNSLPLFGIYWTKVLLGKPMGKKKSIPMQNKHSWQVMREQLTSAKIS